MPPEKIPHALKVLDVDGDGKISLTDMRDAVIQVHVQQWYRKGDNHAGFLLLLLCVCLLVVCTSCLFLSQEPVFYFQHLQHTKEQGHLQRFVASKLHAISTNIHWFTL